MRINCSSFCEPIFETLVIFILNPGKLHVNIENIFRNRWQEIIFHYTLEDLFQSPLEKRDRG